MPDLDLLLLHHQPTMSKRSSVVSTAKLFEFFQRFFREIRHRTTLNAEFKKIDNAKTGFITVDLLVGYVIEQFHLNLSEKQEQQFLSSIKGSTIKFSPEFFLLSYTGRISQFFLNQF